MQPKLFPRDYKMLRYACFNNNDIAQMLNLSPRTVELYMAQVQAKLGARNKREMIVIAIRNNIMSVRNFALTTD